MRSLEVLTSIDVLPTRATWLASRISDLREWGLTARCGCRGFPVHIQIASLADEYGGRRRLEHVLGRLRCRRYLTMPERVDATRGDPLVVRPMARSRY